MSSKSTTASSGRPPKVNKSQKPKQQPLPIRAYLIAFNLLSFFGWCLILSSLIKHVAVGPQTPSYPITFASRVLAKFRPIRVFFVSTYPGVPAPLAVILQRASQVMVHVGSLVAFVQSLAIVEVVHAALGWVRSPVPTTAIQVASRLFLVWGVTERYAAASGSAWYASMLLAWSVTESFRYPFYANSLMGSDSPGLLWARYTLFYVLYPLGAGSEAMLIFSTLPNHYPWNGSWTPREYVYGSLFVIWWPGLYFMYSHMIKQRKRAIGKGFWGDKLAQQKAEERRQAIQQAAKKIR